MDLQQRFEAKAGRAHFLEKGRVEALEAYLRKKGWLREDEPLASSEVPGEGNMNLVLRAGTARQSLIIKQARPWVEKYPQIDAPLERIQVEAEFYRLIQQDEFLADFTPRLLDWDPENHIMVLEDLGKGVDFTFVYRPDDAIKWEELAPLIDFLSHLHQLPFTPEQKKSFPSNQALKTLNHEHIFYFPYLEDNGFDLDTVQPGLQKLAMAYKTNGRLKKKLLALGERYLGAGPCLIHGDYYPGSWLKVAGGVKVIDPEFSYFGRPEFDLGVCMAHLKMARSAPEIIHRTLDAYRRPPGFDEALRSAFTAVEVMRRLIGLAQLPLTLSLEEKEILLEEASLVLLGIF